MKLVGLLTVIEEGYYDFTFPLEFIPSSFKFIDIDLKIKTNQKLTQIYSNLDFIIDEFDGLNEFKSKCKFEDTSSLLQSSFSVYFSTENIGKPSILLGVSEKFPDQIATLISYIP